MSNYNCTCLDHGKENCRATIHEIPGTERSKLESDLLDTIEKLEEQNRSNDEYTSELFDYVLQRCEALRKEHGVEVDNPGPQVYSVTLTKEFDSRVTALKWAEKLVEILPNE